jgi:hypothetical protein
MRSALLLVLLGISSVAQAEDAQRLTLTPHAGLVVQSDLHEGLVVFGDKDDFLKLDPEAGFVLGLQLGVPLGGKLVFTLGLSWAMYDAGYIEKDNVRPDADVDEFRLEPGVLVAVTKFGANTLWLGGGLVVALHAIDNMVWEGDVIDATPWSLGLQGRGALDVGLSERAAIRIQLALGASLPFFGALEEDLARAKNEPNADMDEELRTDATVTIGVAIGL